VRPIDAWCFARGAVLGLALLAAGAAQATLTIGGSLSGLRGSTVAGSVIETSLVNFQAADLELSYDPLVLHFLSLDFPADPLGSPFAFEGTPGLVTLSLATGGQPLNGSDVLLFTLNFSIDPLAPLGQTIAHITSTDLTLFDRPPISMTFSVTNPSTGLPVAGSLELALTALALLPLARRAGRRRA
jgi:hypothetical protein